MSRHLALPIVLLVAPAAAGQTPAPWARPPGYGVTFGPRPAVIGPHRSFHRPLPHPIPRPFPPFGRPGLGGFGGGIGFGSGVGFVPVLYPSWGGYYGGAG